MQRSPVRAVLFDWRGTLVHDPAPQWWVRLALERAGQAADDSTVAALCQALDAAATLPEISAGEVTCDCSPAQHRDWSMAWFAAAGIDAGVADTLYALDFEASAHPFYPDAEIALAGLHERGCRIAVVSDIHFDLRPEFAAARLDSCIDAYLLSFEHGMQKPDPRFFELALEELEVDASDALMVGDRASRDGGAIAVGIETWLLPALPSADAPRGLARLLPLVG